MSERVYAFDLDRVLVDKTGFVVQRVSELYGVEVPADVNIQCPDFWRKYTDLSMEAAASFVLALEMQGDEGIKLMPGAIETLESLWRGDSTSHIVTARSMRGKQGAEAMVERLGIGAFIEALHHSRNPYFSSVRPTKAEVCGQINADLLVDDSLSEVIDVAQSGRVGVLFGNDPWVLPPRDNPLLLQAVDWPSLRQLLGEHHEPAA